ncbi:MAG TPA: alpha/beta hydrolase [Acidimicrobiales bacterium]|nr:alpha/beta hydrolase [Acidimicrobiales bacterium]
MADVVVDGVRFNVVRMGPADMAADGGPVPVASSTPVVLIHGLIMDNLSSYYYTLAPAVARHHDVVCYDLRGHGRSDRPPTGYRLEDAVGDLWGILDALGIEGPAHLVGNSFGGTIALAAAVLTPQRVAGLALVEAHPAFEGWAEELGEELEDLVDGFDGPGMREFLAGRASRGVRRMARTCEELVDECSMLDDFRASRLTAPADLATVPCPALLVYGDLSDVLDRAFAVHEALPSSELHVVEGCSHSLLMESPGEVERLVVPWLARQSPPGPSPDRVAGVRGR